MRSKLPASLHFFVLTGVVFLLQAIPGIGIFLMFAMAAFWSALLINAGLIGIAIEALYGRISRGWLLVPAAYYAGYLGFAAFDHLTLASLKASYEAENASVTIPFDPNRQSLVLDGGIDEEWLTQNFDLPVIYTIDPNNPIGFRSVRMVTKDLCAKVRGDQALTAARILVSGFHDGVRGRRRMEERFCNISMPERPPSPQLRVTWTEQVGKERLLPLRRVFVFATAPDGQSYQLRSGVAHPLSWLPLPMMGCWLNSGGPSWDCGWGFMRDSYTPITARSSAAGEEWLPLAQALRLKPVSIEDRQASNPSAVLARMTEVEKAELAQQEADVDAMISDPLMKSPNWQTGVLANRPQALAERAEAVLTGVERAAAYMGKDRYRARESGRILAGLLARVGQDQLIAFGPRILDLYANAETDHWLWEEDDLLRRLGELGRPALPYLAHPRWSDNSFNDARAEGLCRVGLAGRDVSEPILLAMWARSRDGFDRKNRRTIYVALRRIEVTPPPLSEDRHQLLAKLQSEYGSVTAQSPQSICKTH